MLRLGQSSLRITRGVASPSRSHALLSLPGKQQHGISMLRSLGAVEQGSANRSSTGGSTGPQGAHGISSGSSRINVARNTPSSFSATHLSTPKRLMSTAVGGGNPPHTGDTAASAAAAAGDLGPDAVAGAADAAMAAAAGGVDQVRHGLILQCRWAFTLSYVCTIKLVRSVGITSM